MYSVRTTAKHWVGSPPSGIWEWVDTTKEQLTYRLTLANSFRRGPAVRVRVPGDWYSYSVYGVRADGLRGGVHARVLGGGTHKSSQECMLLGWDHHELSDEVDFRMKYM